MVLIDGQAGIPAVGAGSPPMRAATLERVEADAGVYGLTVAGAGLVAYVDPAFRAGIDEAEIVLEAASGSPRMKRAAGGILGDVNNDGQVNAFDALYVALYSGNPSIILPNNGDISLGDVNGDGTVNLDDALILAAYSVNPSDPSLPAGIGEPVGTTTTTASQQWKLYWTDAGTKKIQRANLDGSNVEDLVTRANGFGYRHPTGIALGFVPVEAGPDLVVRASVSDNTLTPGQLLTLSVTVRNRGTEQAALTTLRYYRSDDATIDSTDTQLLTVAVNSLASLADRAYSIDLTAPTSTGTYYYGACVESVSDEWNTDNNCSSAVTITVAEYDSGDSSSGDSSSGGSSSGGSSSGECDGPCVLGSLCSDSYGNVYVCRSSNDIGSPRPRRTFIPLIPQAP